jgi:hypothetical protein
MKHTRNQLVAVAMIILTAVTGGNALAAQKTKGGPQDEFPFDQVGKVTKHGVDICNVGVNYELHSNVRPPMHPTTHWLVAKSKSDQAILESASKDGSLVQVKGTAMVGVENCKWIAVSSVKPVKK